MSLTVTVSVLAICECVWLNLAVSECVDQCMSLTVSAGIRTVFEPVSECVVCASAGDRYVCRTRSSQGFANCAAECTPGQRRRWREKSMTSARCPASPSSNASLSLVSMWQSNSYCLSLALLFFKSLSQQFSNTFMNEGYCYSTFTNLELATDLLYGTVHWTKVLQCKVTPHPQQKTFLQSNFI